MAGTTIGIDVGKQFLDVATGPEGPVRRIANTPESCAALAHGLLGTQDKESTSPALVVVEATGGYETSVILALQAEGISVALVNPKRVRDFARASGCLAKTDRLDAMVLCAFGIALAPRPIAPVTADALVLSGLVGRRRQIVDMMIAEKTRLLQAEPAVRPWIAVHLEQLKVQLVEVDAAIALAVAADPRLARRRTILTSFPGIGPRVAAVLLAELPELGAIGNKQAAALVGVAPVTRESGQFKGQKHIAGGRAGVRCALYMATLVATRHNPDIRAFYERLTGAGKAKKLAIVAAMRKTVTILNALTRQDQLWTHASTSQDGC